MSWWRKGPKEETLEAWATKRARHLGGQLDKLPPTLGQKHRLDRVFTHPRRPAGFLELKRLGEEPTPEQHFAIQELLARGYVAAWASDRAGVERFFATCMAPPLTLALDILQEATEAKKREKDARHGAARAVVPGRPGRRLPDGSGLAAARGLVPAVNLDQEGL